MKNKRIITAILLLVLATLACNSNSNSNPVITPVSATIDSIVNESSKTFETPENWNVVPEPCKKSITRLILTSSTDSISASSSLFQKNIMQKDGQIVYLYHFLAANHSVINKETNSIRNIEIKFVTADNTEHTVGYLGYSQIYDTNNNPTDITILSVISLENIEVNISTIIPGTNLVPNSTNFYFILGYPKPSLKLNYVVAVTDKYTVDDVGYQTVTLRQVNEVSAANLGSSGGPVCNQNGEIVGTLKSIYTTDLGIFDIEINPSNIQEQISSAINSSVQTMIQNGYSLQQ